MTRYLIIGASGQVGEHLYAFLKNNGEHVIGTYYQHAQPGLYLLDVRNAKAVVELLQQVQPDVVYLPAALTNVDYCETCPDLAYESNVVGVCNVVRATNNMNAKLVYFSSDYVFDGVNGPYLEIDPAKPICEYGQQKLISEHYVALHASDYLIVRTTVVYGWESQGKNFIFRLVERLQMGEKIKVPDDQIGSPTYAPNLAEAVVELTNIGAQGVFNLVGPKLASRYDFAVAAAKAFALDSALIDPISTPELKQIAKRPLRAGMIIDKAQSLLRTKFVDYVEGLAMMANEQTEWSAYRG